MLSVYTPSHISTWLDECYASLVAQNYPDWEWVVVLNGTASWERPDDPRVHVHVSSATGVGALKKQAVGLCSGDLLVELDHDDYLRPDALFLIQAAFDINPDASLVYSDFAQVNEDGSPNHDRFAEGFGWTYRMEGEHQVIESKPPTPHNVSYIWYAPNHVRAFRRTHYDKAGGYDENREICDDADLMCRLYGTGPFVAIPACLYYQRIHGGNTQRDPATNAKIQAETVELYDRWIQPNALVWAQREGLACFDFGGAHDCPEEYEAVDAALGHGDILDWLANCEDNIIGVIRAVDFIEHIADKVTLMNEIYRVLAPGAMFLSLTPSTDGRGAFCDPTHVAFYNELSFRYYCDEQFAKYVPAITARFRQSRLFTYFPTPWHEEHNVPYVCCNFCKDIP